ncbi:MAG TPA: hypothetical protein VKN18_23765 [Blastocatellia bacterium]|nr:hypothetical protein [Blastocatellia bacterium]
MKRYYLACCRVIWELLPQDASRNGVKVAERELDGLASATEIYEAEYHAEGALSILTIIASRSLSSGG